MSRRLGVITALILSLIILVGGKLYTRSSETFEERTLFTISQVLTPPHGSVYLGSKTFQLLNQTVEVYTWRENTTLYEAILNQENQIINATTYVHTHENATMTPTLAVLLAQQALIKETQYPPGHQNLKSPRFEYYTFREKGPNWDVEWGLCSGNYTISNIDFEIRLYTETGETQVLKNQFDEIPSIPIFDPPSINSQEAIVLAEKAFLASMNYSHIDSTRVREIRISPPGDHFIDEPFRLYWTVIVSGKGMDGGVPTTRSPVFHVDAQTGEILSSYYVSIGWNTINWKISNHPYYGEVYPQIHDNTPEGYVYPLSMEEVWEFVTNHRNFRTPPMLNQTFEIDAYNWTNQAKDYSLEHIFLETNWKGEPLLGVLWVKSHNWVKTGAIYPLDNISMAEWFLPRLGGYFMLIDPVTGEILKTEQGKEIDSPTNHLNLTRDQAISIVESSRKTRVFIQPDNLVQAEPRILLPTLENLVSFNPFFDKIFLANETVHTYQIYWIVQYENPEAHQSGTYLVDAETGELFFYVEYLPLDYKAKVSRVQGFNNPPGSSSSVESLFLTPINDSFNVGRRNDTVYEYIESSTRYTVRLKEGDLVQYAFNSTHPIQFDLTGTSLNNRTIEQGQGNVFQVEHTGEYVFSFGAEPPVYANVTFSLTLIDPTSLSDSPS